jgi:hypothetical protein
MTESRDIVSALADQRKGDVKKLSKIRKRMNQLRAHFVEFRDLAEQAHVLHERIRTNVGVLGAGFLKEQELSTVNEQRRNTKLWRAVREIVRQATRVRIVELEAVLDSLSFKVSRQAIESAISTHPHVFRITKKGREKFVSIREH